MGRFSVQMVLESATPDRTGIPTLFSGTDLAPAVGREAGVRNSATRNLDKILKLGGKEGRGRDGRGGGLRRN